MRPGQVALYVLRFDLVGNSALLARNTFSEVHADLLPMVANESQIEMRYIIGFIRTMKM